MRGLFVFAAVAAISFTSAAPVAAAQTAAAVDRSAWPAALDALAVSLEKDYVFADRGKAAARQLRQRRSALMKAGSAESFAKSVGELVNAELKDAHLYFAYDRAQHARLSAPPSATSETPPKPDVGARGFTRVERLAGNIGLIQLDSMDDVDPVSGARAVAAMELMRGAEVVIIDLRRNAGGSGRMNQLLSTYFFAADDDKWLVSNENRSAGTFVQEWTQPYVPGERMPAVPLYILTGPGTGSAAEGFAYNLRALGRAKVVGEKSAGGAHSGDFKPLPGGFVVFIPTGRTINPLTKANWERTGVPLDSAVGWRPALNEAQRMIWTERAKTAAAGSPEADLAQWQIAYHQAKVTPAKLPGDADALVGDYAEGLKITRQGDLLYHSKNGPTRPLLTLANGDFVLEWSDHYGPGTSRLRFVRAADGRVTGVQELIRHEPLKVATFDLARLS